MASYSELERMYPDLARQALLDDIYEAFCNNYGLNGFIKCGIHNETLRAGYAEFVDAYYAEVASKSLNVWSGRRTYVKGNTVIMENVARITPLFPWFENELEECKEEYDDDEEFEVLQEISANVDL